MDKNLQLNVCKMLDFLPVKHNCTIQIKHTQSGYLAFWFKSSHYHAFYYCHPSGCWRTRCAPCFFFLYCLFSFYDPGGTRVLCCGQMGHICREETQSGCNMCDEAGREIDKWEMLVSNMEQPKQRETQQDSNHLACITLFIYLFVCFCHTGWGIPLCVCPTLKWQQRQQQGLQTKINMWQERRFLFHDRQLLRMQMLFTGNNLLTCAIGFILSNVPNLPNTSCYFENVGKVKHAL